MNSDLYYEAHITIDPVFGLDLKDAKDFCEIYGFKVADLLMKKRAEDTPERSQYDTFATGHSQNYLDLGIRMQGCIKHLQGQGYKVRRYKIEDTLMDSRSKDVLGLL